jgi:membrane protein
MPDKIPVRQRIEKARHFVRRGVWEVEPTGLGALRAWILYNIRMAILVVEGTIHDQLLLRAAALTYKTVFSIVPLLAVMLAFFKGFGGTEKAGEELRQAALDKISPGLSQVMEGLNNSIANINAGAVGGIGIILLLYTAISLLTTVEQSFNHIWGMKKGRSFFWRCIIYWGVITLGPVVFMTSLTATAFVENSGLMGWIRENGGHANAGILFLMPFLFAWFGFASLYYFIPNTPVRWRSAFVGGIVGGTLWETAKVGYVYYITSMAQSTWKIYGALGAVPIFLLWIYLSWVIVLFGAEWAFAHQNVRTYRREIATETPSQAAHQELALMAMLLVAREYLAGGEPVTLQRIGEAFNVPVRFANDVLFRLGGAGLVREVSGTEPGYVPGRDASTISVKAVLDAVRRAGANPVLGGPEGDGVVRSLLGRADSALDAELGRVMIGTLARADAEGAASREERGRGGEKKDR